MRVNNDAAAPVGRRRGRRPSRPRRPRAAEGGVARADPRARAARSRRSSGGGGSRPATSGSPSPSRRRAACCAPRRSPRRATRIATHGRGRRGLLPRAWRRAVGRTGPSCSIPWRGWSPSPRPRGSSPRGSWAASRTSATSRHSRRRPLARGSSAVEGAGCIHPDQVAVLNRVFSPDPAKVEYARRVVEAFEEGLKRGTASVNLDGKMVDVPVVSAPRSFSPGSASSRRPSGARRKLARGSADRGRRPPNRHRQEGNVDFRLTDEQRRMVDTLRKFRRDVLEPNAIKYLDGTFPHEHMASWRRWGFSAWPCRRSTAAPGSACSTPCWRWRRSARPAT